MNLSGLKTPCWLVACYSVALAKDSWRFTKNVELQCVSSPRLLRRGAPTRRVSAIFTRAIFLSLHSRI